jgi:Flp pilus assembly protein TadG
MLFAVALPVIIIGVGLVIDGGNALAQRRGSQNASDLAALAGARIIAERIAGDTVNGTDANVVAAIDATIAANGGLALTYGSPSGPQYFNQNGNATGWVGAGTIPANTVGVKLGSSRTWKPYFLSLFGFNGWPGWRRPSSTARRRAVMRMSARTPTARVTRSI